MTKDPYILTFTAIGERIPTFNWDKACLTVPYVKADGFKSAVLDATYVSFTGVDADELVSKVLRSVIELALGTVETSPEQMDIERTRLRAKYGV